MTDRPLELAVVGSGVSGLTAAHLPAKRHHGTLLQPHDRLAAAVEEIGNEVGVVPEDADIQFRAGFDPFSAH